MNISNTNTFQNTRHALQARAIQRRVYHAQIRLFLFYMLVIYGIEKGIKHFFLNICCKTRSLSILESIVRTSSNMSTPSIAFVIASAISEAV